MKDHLNFVNKKIHMQSEKTIRKMNINNFLIRGLIINVLSSKRSSYLTLLLPVQRCEACIFWPDSREMLYNPNPLIWIFFSPICRNILLLEERSWLLHILIFFIWHYDWDYLILFKPNVFLLITSSWIRSSTWN